MKIRFQDHIFDTNNIIRITPIELYPSAYRFSIICTDKEILDFHSCCYNCKDKLEKAREQIISLWENPVYKIKLKECTSSVPTINP